MSGPRRRVLTVGGILFVVLVVVCTTRRESKRAFVAASIAHSGIFTPPPEPGESRWQRFLNAAEFYWDFAEIPIDRQKRLSLLNPVLQTLVQEINRRQGAGEDMHYSMHIYRDIRWRMNFTPDVSGTRTEIDLLRKSLGETDRQRSAQEQQEADGSWGLGINDWYLRLYYSVDEVIACHPPPHYPLSFLDRINSPQNLDAVLDADLYDNFTRTGTFNREELDETFSAIARLLFAPKPVNCYAFNPQLHDALLAFIGHWQNPTTGCWGQWLVDRNGRVWKMDDMGMTFHVVSDLGGAVEHKDLIARRLLQLDRVDFPAGILFEGHYENHLNWDAVKIFRIAWPNLDETTRRQARAEIAQMLQWCLTESYQPNGSFKVSDLDDTPGDAFRYGIWFLEEAGYFQRKERFWTDKDFPDSDRLRRQIEARLQEVGLNDPAMQEAYSTLHAMD